MSFKKRLYLFWKIGEYVFNKQKNYDKATFKCSELLKYKYGMSNTFSVQNVNYMKKFYSCFPIYFKELNFLTFEHYKLLVDVIESSERYFYFRIALFCNSDVSELKEIIDGKMYFCIKNNN